MKSIKERMESYLNSADSKINVTWVKAILLGILAGVFIAFAGVGNTIAQGLVDPGIARVVAAAVFPIGLIMVVVSGSELFTGDCLLIAPLLNKNIKLGKTLAFLGIVYLANFVGSVLVAVLSVYGGVLNSVSSTVIAIAQAKSSLTFIQAFFKGILCNVLVCVAVWMTFSTTKVSAKAICCFVPVFLFVFCGLEHSIANMYYLPAGLLMGIENGVSISVADMLVNNLLPVTLGNIVGGAIVGATYWAIAKK